MLAKSTSRSPQIGQNIIKATSLKTKAKYPYLTQRQTKKELFKFSSCHGNYMLLGQIRRINCHYEDIIKIALRLAQTDEPVSTIRWH